MDKYLLVRVQLIIPVWCFNTTWMVAAPKETKQNYKKKTGKFQHSKELSSNTMVFFSEYENSKIV